MPADGDAFLIQITIGFTHSLKAPPKWLPAHHATDFHAGLNHRAWLFLLSLPPPCWSSEFTCSEISHLGSNKTDSSLGLSPPLILLLLRWRTPAGDPKFPDDTNIYFWFGTAHKPLGKLSVSPFLFLDAFKCQWKHVVHLWPLVPLSRTHSLERGYMIWT